MTLFLIILPRVLQKERRLLENLRLDLDSCKTRLKKAKLAEAKAAVSVFSATPPPPQSLICDLTHDGAFIYNE